MTAAERPNHSDVVGILFLVALFFGWTALAVYGGWITARHNVVLLDGTSLEKEGYYDCARKVFQ